MEPDPFTIRPFRPEDVSSVKRLIDATIDACYVSVYSRAAVRYFREFHAPERILADAHDGQTVVLDSGGEIVGTGTLVDAYIKRVFVRPDMQGHGLGKRIMRDLELRAREAGHASVGLSSSSVSQSFYERLGYAVIAPAFILVGNRERLDYCDMRKGLAPGVASSFPPEPEAAVGT